MSSTVLGRRGWPLQTRALAATAVAVALGGLFAVQPAWGVIGIAGAVFVTVVMITVPVAMAIWIAAVFVVPGRATSVMELLIGIAWLGSLAARPGLIRQTLPGQRVLVGALALLLAWLCLSGLWARDTEMTWHELRWWLVAGGVLLVAATTIARPGQVRLILLALVIGALASVLIGFVHPQSSPSKRFTGLAGDPNYLAAQLVPAIVFAVALFGDSRRLVVRAVLGASIAALAVALAATESRSGLIAVGVIVVAAAMLLKRQRRRALVAIVLIAAVAGTWFALSPSALHRVTSFNDGGSGRSTLWLVAWRLAKDYAPEGVGLGNFRALAQYHVRQPGGLRYVQQIDEPHVVHNTYLQLLAETGVIGLSLFLGVAGACLAAAHRAGKLFEHLGRPDLVRLSYAVLLAQVGIFTLQVFLPDAYDVRFWVEMGLGPALLTIASRWLSWQRESLPTDFAQLSNATVSTT